MSKSGKVRKPISSKVQSLNAMLARRRGVRSLNKRFLVVCEDTKSSCAYFEALKSHLGLDALSVRVTHSHGKTQPIQVVDETVRLKYEAARPTSGTVPFSQVWCVIDGDFGEKINNARTRADANDIKLAISTKCFEYWILLHFEHNESAATDCNGHVKTLKAKKYLPHYDKGKASFHDVVTNVDLACRRAENLRKPGIARGDRPESQNPCSEVYLLVNAIRDGS